MTIIPIVQIKACKLTLHCGDQPKLKLLRNTKRKQSKISRFGIVPHYLSIAPKRWAGSVLSCISRSSASSGADTVSETSLHYTPTVSSLPNLHLALPCSLSSR
ncbi:hypothetical protein EPR50_G00068190 [Scomber scombrus]|uniref:Uncharacterized protein n=1 Tax=Scomber scombrus TaxID=13677 RepID=A0AAV1N6X4_SCOSC